MSKRLLSAMLTVLTVLSLMGTAVLPVTAADNAFTVFTDNVEYKALGTAASNMWTLNAAMQTSDLKTVNFWVRVTDVTSPIYLVGTRFGFTTTDGTAIVSFGTGSNNIQNHAFYVPEAGDYIITAKLADDNAIAWNYVPENGGFKAITMFGAAAIDAAEYDANGTMSGTDAKLALMGIIEGAPAFDRSVYYITDDILGEGAQTYTEGVLKGINYSGSNPNQYTNSNIGFTKVGAHPFTAPAVEGYEFTGWTDDYGRPAISLVTDYLMAEYKPLATNYIASLSTEGAGRNGKLTLKLADTSLGITSGSVVVKYDMNKFYFHKDTDNDGVITVNYSSVAADGTVGRLTYRTTANIACNTAINLSGTAKIGSTPFEIEAYDHIANINPLFGQGEQAINKNNGATLPEKQDMWKGTVALENATGMTLVYKVDGIVTPVVANNFGISYTALHASGTVKSKGDNSGGWDYWWNQTNSHELTFAKDGYYYIYVNASIGGVASFTKFEGFHIFSDKTTTDVLTASRALRTNTNANATFELLTVYANNMEVTVNFRNGDGSLIASVPYKYTNFNGLTPADSGLVKGELVSASDIFEASGIKAPKLDCYRIKEWVDLSGNVMDAVYTDCDVYPVWEESPDAADHNMGAYVSNNDASCGVDGTLTATCVDCGKVTHTVTDYGTATDHDHKWTTITAPTNTKEGSEKGVCACGDTITRGLACLVPNDINGDGAVNIIDAQIVAQYIAQNGATGKWNLTSCNLLTADRNGDGEVSQSDLLAITAEIVAA